MTAPALCWSCEFWGAKVSQLTLLSLGRLRTERTSIMLKRVGERMFFCM